MKKLKKAVNEGYFEELIRKYLLENPHGCIMTLVPKKGLAAQREKELEEKLEAYRSSLSEEQLDAMVEKTKALEAYQEDRRRSKALECIPMLKRSDIKREAAKIINEELTVDDSLFLYHDVCTNGIGYVDLMFKTDSIAPEQIPYLGLLKSVLGYVDTENYTYGELFNEINANTGGINCGVEVFDRADSTEEFQAMFSVRGKALYTKMDFLFKMIGEILNSSKLEDTKRLYEIVASVKSRAQVNLTGAGHSTAVLRAAAYSSPMAAFQDEMAGIGIDGQSWSAIAVDENGNVLTNTPIWMDTRAQDICDELNERIGKDRIFKLCGNSLQPSYTTPKIVWYQRNLPEVYAKTAKILQSNSYIAFKLTGKMTQDVSQGYGLHCFNMQEMTWDLQCVRSSDFQRICFLKSIHAML